MLHHLKIPDTFAEWILTHRLRVLFCYAMLTALAVVVVWQTPLRVSLLQGFMPDRDEYQAYVDRASEFGGGSDDLIYVATREGDELFTAERLNRVRAAARDLEQLPEVARVFSIAHARRLVSGRSLSARDVIARTVLRCQLARGVVPDLEGRSVTAELYWPESAAEQQKVDLSALREPIRRDPIAGHLVSKGGDAQTMLVWLADSGQLLNCPRSGIRGRIERVLTAHGLGRDGIHCVGTLVIQDWMYEEAVRAFLWVLPAVALLVCVMVYSIFHRLAYVLLTLVIAGIAIVWTVGLTAAIFGEITMLVAATPGLVLIISTADTIHLISAYTVELQHGLTRRAAVAKAVQDVGGACLLTSLTTFVGFLSLAVVPAVAVRHVAVACAIGVVGALLLALTLVPMALMFLRPPIVASERSPLNRGLEIAVGLCRRWSVGRPGKVLALHLLLFAVAVGAATTIQLDADLAARFVRGHPVRRDIEFFHEEVIGTTAIELTLRTDPAQTLSPAMLSGLDRFEKRLASTEQVQSVSSAATLLRLADDMLGTQRPGGDPPTQAEAAATVELLHQMAPDAVDGFISREKGLLRVAVQVTSTRVIEVGQLAKELEEIAENCLPDDVEVTSSGFYVVIGNAAREILVSQAKGFVLCCACVMLVITLGLRSIRLGLIAMLPNLLPLALLGGFLALTCGMVDSDILGVVIISFGLAVDDTIHFLHRYDVERRLSTDKREAVERTFHYTGRAIIRTTVILGVGLLPFGLSGYLSIRLLGTYLVFVLVCAVLADLLLLPALVLQFDIENGEQEK